MPARSEAAKERARARARENYRRNAERKIALAKVWREANRDRVRATDTARRRADPDTHNARKRAWRAATSDPNSASRAWKATHPEAVRTTGQRRRAREVNAPGSLTADDWARILVEFDHCCAYCNARDLPLEIEHMTPLSRGGHHDPTNVVPACKTCNRRKGAKTVFEFLELTSRTPPKGQQDS